MQGSENQPYTQGIQAEERAHSEGKIARTIENQTARVPSDVFLWAALGAMAVAAVVQLREPRQWSLFVGQWAAPLLLFGVYNKLVKVAGSDRTQGNGSAQGPARAW